MDQVREPAPVRDTAITRPSIGLALTEPARALAKFAGLPAAAPWLSFAPRGDGHGVLVLPGLMASDTSTAACCAGSCAGSAIPRAGWNLGRNLGPTAESWLSCRAR